MLSFQDQLHKSESSVQKPLSATTPSWRSARIQAAIPPSSHRQQDPNHANSTVFLHVFFLPIRERFNGDKCTVNSPNARLPISTPCYQSSLSCRARAHLFEWQHECQALWMMKLRRRANWERFVVGSRPGSVHRLSLRGFLGVLR